MMVRDVCHCCAQRFFGRSCDCWCVTSEIRTAAPSDVCHDWSTEPYLKTYLLLVLFLRDDDLCRYKILRN